MKNLLILVAVLLISVACKEKEQVAIAFGNNALLPLPRQLETQPFGFTFDENTVIQSNLDSDTSVLEALEELFSSKDLTLNAIPIGSAPLNNVVLVTLTDSIMAEEGYVLDINHKALRLKAVTEQGLYRGLQTLKQLPLQRVVLPTSKDTVSGYPGTKIVDEPSFGYRGAMLDVARHFFTVDQVKRYIDQLASYKINTLHLHLTDDQGWRIEIKSWPDLTLKGGQTGVGGGPGGFYTQEDYKKIINYAATKYMTVIPEIDMPGHTNAALVAYPELNCDGKPREMYTGMRVGFSTLCVDKAITYQFLDDVIGEIAAITPGDYFHIGGDESLATSDEDYMTFLHKVHPILEKHGKKLMGWEDIGAADVPEGTIIQYWTNEKNAVKAAHKGAQVVLSLAPKTYLDMKYTDTTRIGLRWAGPTSIDTAYLWRPYDLLKEVPKEQIIGIESPLWTETVRTTADIEYLAFPRLIGHAELGWSAIDSLSWESYKGRLKQHLKVLDRQGVNYYKSPLLD